MPLDIVHVLIDMLAAAVEFGRVNLHDQGLAAVGRQGDPGRERHPIVGVDDVEFLRFGDLHHAHRIPVDLFADVGAIGGGTLGRFLRHAGSGGCRRADRGLPCRP